MFFAHIIHDTAFVAHKKVGNLNILSIMNNFLVLAYSPILRVNCIYMYKFDNYRRFYFHLNCLLKSMKFVNNEMKKLHLTPTVMLQFVYVCH